MIEGSRNAIDSSFGMFTLILACFLVRWSYKDLGINITSRNLWVILCSVESVLKDWLTDIMEKFDTSFSVEDEENDKWESLDSPIITNLTVLYMMRLSMLAMPMIKIDVLQRKRTEKIM